MNPFEVTRDPDGGLPTVRVKRGYVVLTKEEDERAAERIAEILDENAKLHKLLKKACILLPLCDMPNAEVDGLASEVIERAEKLGIEVPQ